MTSASSARVARRAAEKLIAQKTAYKPGDAPKSIITLTESANGGFTIGLGLHGARMEELYPGKAHPLSVVDVIAIAVATVIRQQPQEFQDTVSLVNNTLRDINNDITGGKSIEEALAAADPSVTGAMGDIGPFDEAANVG
jgi:hypothetical protein